MNKMIIFILGYGNDDEYIERFKNIINSLHRIEYIYPFTDQNYETTLNDIIERVNDITLIGYSIGSIIALKYAKKYKNKVKKLICISIPTVFPIINKHKLRITNDEHVQPLHGNNHIKSYVFNLILYLSEYSRFICNLFYIFLNNPPKYIIKKITNQDSKYSINILKNTLLRSNVFALVKELDIKVDIIVGEFDEYCKYCEIIWDHNKNVILHRLTNGNHHELVNNPARIVDKIDFIVKKNIRYI